MLSDFVFVSKYAKYNEKLNRRETFEETIDRVMDMHEKKVAGRIPKQELDTLRDMLKQKKIVGSQRALQFGGEAIEEKNWRIFNCVSSFVDRIRYFAEDFYLLLLGSGTGMNVCDVHVNKLPKLVDKIEKTEIFVIPDSIEGWAMAVDRLLNAYYGNNPLPLFDSSQIRPKGAKLRHGGKAPGPDDLMQTLTLINRILNKALGRKLTPLECVDISMHLASCTRAGGIRRASKIVFFDATNEDILNCKTGSWYVENSQRSCANFSAVILPSTPKELYDTIAQRTKEWGEPGVVFFEHEDFCLNPCAEAAMCPQLITDPNGKVVREYTLDMLRNKQTYIDKGYKYESGWQACNLTSINGALINNFEDFAKATYYATLLGTLQALYTNHGYLTEVSQKIVERENLLGVSITGMMMNKDILLDANYQKQCALLAVEVNHKFSKMLGINQSSRITLIKPEGTISLVLESTSGIHPAHAQKYIRHVVCKTNEPPYIHFNKQNPQACFDKYNPTVDPNNLASKDQKVIAFPIEFPNALYSYDLTAIEMLKYAKITQDNWIKYGTALPNSCEKLKHNVSVTVSVNEDEWKEVFDFLWEHRDSFTGVSMLPRFGDYAYKQAPFVRVYELNEIAEDDPYRKEKIEMYHLWYNLRETMKKVDYIDLIEYEDETSFMAEVACAGGKCEVTF